MPSTATIALDRRSRDEKNRIDCRLQSFSSVLMTASVTYRFQRDVCSIAISFATQTDDGSSPSRSYLWIFGKSSSYRGLPTFCQLRMAVSELAIFSILIGRVRFWHQQCCCNKSTHTPLSFSHCCHRLRHQHRAITSTLPMATDGKKKRTHRGHRRRRRKTSVSASAANNHSTSLSPKLERSQQSDGHSNCPTCQQPVPSSEDCRVTPSRRQAAKMTNPRRSPF